MAAPEPKLYDVAVVGAGPAGCSAARTLAEKGCKVALIEKAALPRYKTCGGGVLGRARKLLPETTQRIVERECCSVSLNVSGAGAVFAAKRSSPLVYMTMRAELDCLLAREAQRHGAELFESCLVRDLKAEADFVELAGDTRTFRAKFVIAADGVHSAIAKAAGWSGLPRLAPALEWEVHLPEHDFQRFDKTARFDFDVLQAGYAWVFPKREHLSIGILSMHRRSNNLQAKLEHYLKRLGITAIESAARHGYLIPVAPRREKLASGRVLLAGDAAGVVDPVTAEGISYALMTGQLAAQAIVESGFDPAQVSRRYDGLLEEKVLGELKAASFLAHFLYHCPRLRTWVFRRSGQRLADFVADVVMGEASYSVALKSPSNYLKLLGLWPRHWLPGPRQE